MRVQAQPLSPVPPSVVLVAAPVEPVALLVVESLEVVVGPALVGLGSVVGDVVVPGVPVVAPGLVPLLPLSSVVGFSFKMHSLTDWQVSLASVQVAFEQEPPWTVGAGSKHS